MSELHPDVERSMVDSMNHHIMKEASCAIERRFLETLAQHIRTTFGCEVSVAPHPDFNPETFRKTYLVTVNGRVFDLESENPFTKTEQFEWFAESLYRKSLRN